ncbi:unnamed protein product [Chondrus crispus]|uniref:Uncharacterized protein n=1 Tax=Chondrus crispus TaxID=2769 RepID=R7QLW5_CHOCR|nr:unnamed protein product [Chondrus crispus]CDF38385.1 unnamed protein product [Chondrus crispus]|eukprot:XP_005718278.1 unnamed protein product [Chondrus crispus]
MEVSTIKSSSRSATVQCGHAP